jgi:predicted O-linked N-acetylglucosamine transferase (SPINDLY family)
VPEARLRLKGSHATSEAFRTRFLSFLAARGVDPARIELADWLASGTAHLEAYKSVDVALDTFPYNGTTTTCEALWMGVPVVTRAGDRHASRVGASLLETVGLAELVTSDWDAYVEVAARLMRERGRLAAERASLRARMHASALGDAVRFTRDLEEAYLDVWQAHRAPEGVARAANIVVRPGRRAGIHLSPDDPSPELARLQAERAFGPPGGGFITSLLRPGDDVVVVGAGACAGAVAAAIAVGPTGRVRLFEADGRVATIAGESRRRSDLGWLEICEDGVVDAFREPGSFGDARCVLAYGSVDELERGTGLAAPGVPWIVEVSAFGPALDRARLGAGDRSIFRFLPGLDALEPISRDAPLDEHVRTWFALSSSGVERLGLRERIVPLDPAEPGTLDEAFVASWWSSNGCGCEQLDPSRPLDEAIAWFAMIHAGGTLVERAARLRRALAVIEAEAARKPCAATTLALVRVALAAGRPGLAVGSLQALLDRGDFVVAPGEAFLPALARFESPVSSASEARERTAEPAIIAQAIEALIKAARPSTLDREGTLALLEMFESLGHPDDEMRRRLELARREARGRGPTEPTGHDLSRARSKLREAGDAYTRGDAPEAAALEAARLDPTQAGVFELARAAARTAQDPAGALSTWSAYALGAPSPHAACELIADLVGAKAYREADALGTDALARFPESRILAHLAGVAANAAGRFEAAEAAFSRCAPTGTRGADALEFQAQRAKFRGDYGAAHEAYARALELAPGAPRLGSAALVTMNYDPGLSRDRVLRAHREWGERHRGRTRAWIGRLDRSADRPLHVGYVSTDFRRHAVASFALPLIEAHSASSVRVTCYASCREDDVSARFRALPVRFQNILGVPDREVARLIADDAIDVLVDLNGHMGEHRLGVFGAAPAPIQVTYLGYPNTTGLRAIDYRLTDVRAEPVDADAYHTERLVRLERCAWAFRPLVEAPKPRRAGGRGLVFGSFSNLFKLSNELLDMWAEILRAMPDAMLLIKARGLVWEPARERILRRFGDRGVAAARITLAPPTLSVEEHLATYGSVDVALDSAPYCGTTTTCDALFMGVPVVTLAGDRHAALVGKSLLGAVGLERLVAKTPAEYVAIALDLAGDAAGRARKPPELRYTFRSSPRGDARAHAVDVESAYRRMWIDWLHDNAAR